LTFLALSTLDDFERRSILAVSNITSITLFSDMLLVNKKYALNPQPTFEDGRGYLNVQN
jgi:hypothetical protein